MATGGKSVTTEQRRYEDELVRAHLPLVKYAVNEMASRVPRHVPRTDLVSAGMEGLAQAARSFDAKRGASFDRYASTRIKGALLDELRRRDWASRSVRCKARQVNAVTDELTARLGRAPTAREVAVAARMDERSVTALNEDVYRAAVLNFDSLAAHGDADELLPSDGRSPDAVVLEQERQAYLLDAVAALPERLRRVVVGYFFEERPMQELGDELGVTESRISQLRAEALLLLKDGLNSQLEPDLVSERTSSSSRVSRRKAAYYSAIAASSDFRTRVSGRSKSLAAVSAAQTA